MNDYEKRTTLHKYNIGQLGREGRGIKLSTGKYENSLTFPKQ